jgi:hypothetical protein
MRRWDWNNGDATIMRRDLKVIQLDGGKVRMAGQQKKLCEFEDAFLRD